MGRREIREFKRKYEKELKEMQKKREEERCEWYGRMGQGLPYKDVVEQSRVYKRVVRREKQEKELEQRTKEMSLGKVRARMENYAKISKVLHWPTVSPVKKQEMEVIRKKLEEKNKRRLSGSTSRNIYTSLNRIK